MRIALVGDRNESVGAHRAIPMALALAGEKIGAAVEGVWRGTDAIDEGDLARFDGIWCVPASPYASMDGALRAIRLARTRPLPFLGTCGGFQHALIEWARGELGLAAADHEETNPGAEMPLVGRLACPLVGVKGIVRYVPGTRLAAAMGALESEERFHCRFGANPRYRGLLDESRGLRVAATGPEGEVRGIEIAAHPFFVATLFQPELAALDSRLHPLVLSFAENCARHHFRSTEHPAGHGFE